MVVFFDVLGMPNYIMHIDKIYIFKYNCILKCLIFFSFLSALKSIHNVGKSLKKFKNYDKLLVITNKITIYCVVVVSPFLLIFSSVYRSLEHHPLIISILPCRRN